MTLTEKLRKKNLSAKKDSEILAEALIALIDKLNRENTEKQFLIRSVQVLYYAKGLLWRKHWLLLRRHLLDKLKESKTSKHIYDA